MHRISRLLLVVVFMVCASAAAADGAYPERPVHLIVGFPPGSQPDIVARLLAERLSGIVGKPVVVDNVTGAAGNIAADRLAKAAHDGYTIGLLSQTHLVVNPALYKLPYDPVSDFAPISRVVVSAYMLVVNPGVPATDVTTLVALARGHPRGLTFASAGAGSGSHMAAELFDATTRIDIRHIPYKGVVAAVPDLVGGLVSMMFAPIPVVAPLVKTGKLRAIAVTSLNRSAAGLEVATVAESGYPGFEATNWYGLLAPGGTPVEIVATLSEATRKALAVATLRDKLGEIGMEVLASSPEEFTATIKRELPKWSGVIRDAAITAD